MEYFTLFYTNYLIHWCFIEYLSIFIWFSWYIFLCLDYHIDESLKEYFTVLYRLPYRLVFHGIFYCVVLPGWKLKQKTCIRFVEAQMMLHKPLFTYYFLKCNFPMPPFVRLLFVIWSVIWSVGLSLFTKKAWKLHFKALVSFNIQLTDIHYWS